MAIEKTMQATMTNSNNHYITLRKNPMGIIELEIGFRGDYHDKKSSYSIDVSLKDLHDIQTLINEFTAEMTK